MKKYKKPELLAPAGDLEKLKIAVIYGADAVYIGGQSFGLRAKAKNFDHDSMKEGIEFAHAHGVKVYVTANIYAHNEDFAGMKEFFLEVEELGADALIISDPGIFSVARRTVPNMEIHISTQANNTNYMSAMFWKDLGASRVVVARELSLSEINEIFKNVVDIEIEAFVHGAMCISYSGRCLLSNYMTERDANRGGCSQACRWKYHLVEENRPGEYLPVYEDDRGTYIFNSKDLCMITNIGDLVESGISSFKIEGRMKTPYYVGTVVKAYREAIDDYFEDTDLYESKKQFYFDEVQKNSHRHFSTGFYYGKTDETNQVYESSSYIRMFDFVGIVLEYDTDTGFVTVEQRNKFSVGDTIEFFLAKGENFSLQILEMYSENNEQILEAPHPQQIIKLKVDRPLNKFDMLRKQI